MGTWIRAAKTVRILAADPASPADGEIWYNSTDGKLRVQRGAATRDYPYSGTIVDADVDASAAIAKSKLAALAIVDADVDASAAIAKSKIASAGTWANAEIAQFPALGTAPSPARQTAIVNAEVDASAAIEGSKLANIPASKINSEELGVARIPRLPIDKSGALIGQTPYTLKAYTSGTGYSGGTPTKNSVTLTQPATTSGYAKRKGNESITYGWIGAYLQTSVTPGVQDICVLGASDSTDNAPNNGIYVGDLNHQYKAQVKEGGTQSLISGTPSNYATKRFAEALLNPAEAEFFVDGVSVGTLSTNLPDVALTGPEAYVSGTATGQALTMTVSSQ